MYSNTQPEIIHHEFPLPIITNTSLDNGLQVYNTKKGPGMISNKPLLVQKIVCPAQINHCILPESFSL
jgi:hypothetical protein